MDNYGNLEDNIINNSSISSHVSQIYDVPTGDTETLRTGKAIVRCFKGSDLWRCTADSPTVTVPRELRFLRMKWH